MAFKVNQVARGDFSKAVYSLVGKGYVASTGVVALSGTGENLLLLIVNSSSNTVNAKSVLRKFFDSTSGHFATFRIYFNPTVSAAGTAGAAVNTNALAQAAPIASVMTVTTGPTASPKGTLVSTVSAGNVEVDSELPLTLGPGSSMLITAQGADTDNVLAEVFWEEE